MSGWGVFWFLVLVAIVGCILLNLKDIKRYLKIRSM
ncbi:DUF6893 family small protein [Marinobacter caseinilyticus]